MPQTQQTIPHEQQIKQSDYPVEDLQGEIAIPCRVPDSFYTNRQWWGLTIFMLAAFPFCYAGVIVTMAGQWWSNDMYSYGFLIPCISLYLIWVRRERLSRIQFHPNYIGGSIVLIFGLFMLLTGHAGSVMTIQEISLIVTITGVVLLLLGRGFLKALWLPIAYLLLMLPVWDIFTDKLHFPFQNFAANIGVILMQSIGISANLHGVFIELPNVTLEVARACSGVNYLIAVIAIGIPLAHLFLKGWPKKVLLVCSSVIIAILANGLRVALIGTLSYYGLSGDGDIHGPLHILQGLFVSMIGYAAIFAGLLILSRRSSAPSSSQKIQSYVSLKKTSFQIPLFLSGSVSILFLLVGGYLHFYKPSPVPLKLALEYFPFEISGWKGSDAIPGDTIFRSPGVDHALFRTYRTASGETIQLYIGYSEFQEQGKELINDKTEKLYSNASKIKVGLGTDNIVEINKSILPGSNLALFWYDINGRIVADRYRVKAYTTWDALIHGRTNGAVIILITEVSNNTENIDKLVHNSEMFIKEIFPLLHNYIS